jgi:hypothetical protein
MRPYDKNLRQRAGPMACTLGFISQLGVEPTNNASEQALRGIVLKRKISGPTRSRRGNDLSGI